MALAPADASKNLVKSLVKGFRVLQAFTSDEPELVLADVARRAELDNGTAFRLLNTLVELGYIQRVSGTRRFRLTFKCLELGFHAIARTDLRTLARPILRGLVGEVNEAASIGVLEGPDVVYVERIQAGLTRLGVDVRIGSRVPVYSSAIGHAIVAFLPRDTQVEVLEARARTRLTEATLTELDDLLARLDQVRTRGYAISDQENVPGLRVVAAPILDADGLPLAGLSVAAPAHRMPLARFVEATASAVMLAAGQLASVIQTSGSSIIQAKAG